MGIFIFAFSPCFGQSSNKPEFFNTGREPLGERDNNFSGGGKRKLFSGKLFGRKKGFDHKKKTQHFTVHKKKDRQAFQKKKYTGKKGWFGKKKSNGWGGRASKQNAKEDKRLFKAPAKKKRNR